MEDNDESLNVKTHLSELICSSKYEFYAEGVVGMGRWITG